jgi:hypothetical protein
MKSLPPSELSLDALQKGLPGLSQSWGQVLCEASSCCLEFHHHPKGVKLTVQGMTKTAFTVHWDIDISDQIIRSWKDEQELAEYGACGIAILLILKLTGYTVIERSKKGTGVDYWLGYKDAALPFQNAARLEVTGILNGNNSSVKARLSKKTEQVKQSDSSGLPAFIAIVEFSAPQSHVVQK